MEQSMPFGSVSHCLLAQSMEIIRGDVNDI